MAQVAYILKSFDEAATDVIERADSICYAYQQDDLDLTLRQLYYVFVANDYFPDDRTWSWDDARKKWQRDPNGTKNANPNYKWLGGIITDARLSGDLDWDYIVDRMREPEGAGTRFSPHWNDPADIVKAAARSYQINKWADQDTYVEVWVEKDALKGVLERACSSLDCSFFSCRGYTSISSLRTAATRLGDKIKEGCTAHVVHLGDHDPSGVDMTRDVEARLSMFIAQDLGYDAPINDRAMKANPDYYAGVADELEIHRIALNMNQVLAYKPPPNPTKLTDSRAKGYIEKHGYESWELDALKPEVLISLIRNHVEAMIDSSRWKPLAEREIKEKATLQKISDRLDDVNEFLED